MHEELIFSENFFSYFNTMQTAESSDAVLDASIKRLYTTSREEPLYFKGPLNNLVALKADIHYAILQQQLDFILNHIKRWGEQQAIPTNGLTDFAERISNPKNDKISIFYARGKKLLEKVAVLLQDNEINLTQRQKILKQLLATDGLEQCVDNCQFLFEHTSNQLSLIKTAKNNFHNFIRTYVTDLAVKVAESCFFPFPKSFIEILCDNNKLPFSSFKNIATNYFLLYAQENRIPVNVLSDVGALNLKSRLNRRQFNYDKFNHDYITSLKENLSIKEIIKKLSEQYHERFTEVLLGAESDNEKIDFIVNELDLLGLDEDFSPHKILDGELRLKAISRLELNIVRRFINNKWLNKPVESTIVLNGKNYKHYSFAKNLEIAWLSWISEDDEENSCFFLDLVNDDNYVPLDPSIRASLIAKVFLIYSVRSNGLQNLNKLLEHYTRTTPITNYLSIDAIADLINTSSDSSLIFKVVHKLRESEVTQLFNRLSIAEKKVLLQKCLSDAEISERYIPYLGQTRKHSANYALKKYFLSVDEGSPDIFKLSKSIIALFLRKGVKDFSHITFPDLGFQYLNDFDFSNCDFSYSVIYQSIKKSRFDSANLSGAKFYAALEDSSFRACDLTKTFFFTLDKKNFLNVDIRQSSLSSRSHRGLVLRGISNFGSTTIVDDHLSISRNQETIFIEVLHDEVRKHLMSLEYEEINSLLIKLKQHDFTDVWLAISSELGGRLLNEYSDIYVIPAGFADPPDYLDTFIDLMQTYICEELESTISKVLYTQKISSMYRAIKRAMQVPASIECGTLAESARSKRSAGENCVTEEKDSELYEPFIEFGKAESQGISLAIAGANEIHYKKILKNIENIHEIKKEGTINQSQREQEKLQIFSSITRKLIGNKIHYLQEVTSSDAAGFVEIKASHGDAIYFSIQRKQIDGREMIKIYCTEVNGHRKLTIKPGFSIAEIAQLYANLLLPKASAEELSFRYYSILTEHQSRKIPIAQLTETDFFTDKQLLSQQHYRIEGIELEAFRELFLINGAIPEVDRLHANIFSDSSVAISFRSEKLASTLWKLTAEQQISLGKIIEKYAIPEAPWSNSEHAHESIVGVLTQFNSQLFEFFKQSAVLNRGISHEQLTKLSEQHVRSALIHEQHTPAEVNRICSNIKGLHNDLKEGASHAVGYTRQGVFLAPALIQAFNGDSRGLKNIMYMVAGDVTINHVGQRLLSNRYFTQKFAKTASILSKSAGFVASPIGKILLVNSFVELGKQMQANPPESPEYQLAEKLIVDNTIIFGSMLIETLGLELGPAGILLDIGITVHQLLASASYLRKKLPFAISYWDAIEVNLGFKQAWLQQKLEEIELFDRQLEQIDRLTAMIGIKFSNALVRVPELIEIREAAAEKKGPQAVQNLRVLTSFLPMDAAASKLQPLTPDKKYGLESFKPLNVNLAPTNGSVRQENTILSRNKQSQLPGNWSISATTETDQGDLFLSSAVSITGGLAALMLKNNASPTDKRMLASFNPCFGDMNIRTGTFLSEKSLYVLIQSFVLPNFIDRFPEHITYKSKFFLTNTNNYIDKITFFVGANDHASEINVQVGTVVILVLPVDPSLGRLKNYFKRITISPRGNLNFGSTEDSVGPSFIGLHDKQELVLSFLLDYKQDYFLSGPIRSTIKSMKFEQLKSDEENPPHFYLSSEQNFSLSVLKGKTHYSMFLSAHYSSTKLFRLNFENNLNVMTVGPRIIKPSYASFTLFIQQPLNELFIMTNAEDAVIALNFSIDFENIKLRIEKYRSGQPLVIEGYYVLSDKQTKVVATCILDDTERKLVLKDVAKLSSFIREAQFFETIAQQGFSGVILYDSKRHTSDWIAYEAGIVTYAGISYFFDAVYGLVAKKGRSSAAYPEIEDFLDIQTNFIDVRNNYSLPLRLTETTVELGEKNLTSLSLRIKFITSSGILPLNLLPKAQVNLRTVRSQETVQMSTARRRRSMRDENTGGKPRINKKMLGTVIKPLFYQIDEKQKLLFNSFTKKALYNSTLSKENELLIYRQKEPYFVKVIIPLPVSAFFSGILSATLDGVGESNKEKYPNLPGFIKYGLKPFFLASISTMSHRLLVAPILSSGVRNEWHSLAANTGLNYLSLLLAQPINQKIVEKTNNKWIAFLLQTLTWIFLWNPSLLTSDEFTTHIVPILIVQFLSGIFFKTGEWLTESTIDYWNQFKKNSSDFFNQFEERGLEPSKVYPMLSNNF